MLLLPSEVSRDENPPPLSASRSPFIARSLLQSPWTHGDGTDRTSELEGRNSQLCPEAFGADPTAAFPCDSGDTCTREEEGGRRSAATAGTGQELGWMRVTGYKLRGKTCGLETS